MSKTVSSDKFKNLTGHARVNDTEFDHLRRKFVLLNRLETLVCHVCTVIKTRSIAWLYTSESIDCLFLIVKMSVYCS